jgi:histidyl-tRNA synthetase
MNKIIQSVKGTRDFYPKEMAMRNWLYQTMREVSSSFGYEEYEGPILETLDLYAAKSGEELVKEQSYVFADRGGDQLTLRPELTPTLARMVAQRQAELVYPLRWWSFGPFWRYERPQKGRTREFFQWNIDLLGPDSPEADAELIAILATFFKQVGLAPDQVAILVNNRKLMDSVIIELGIPIEKKMDISNLIDRRNKLSPADWKAYALTLDITEEQFNGLVSSLDDPELWRRSSELLRLFDALDAMGVAGYVRFDANVVRGLLYYTGTVFEAYDLTGEVRRAINGGGRYDNLLEDVGGQPLPAVGFAMGDVVIGLLLQRLNLVPANLGQAPAPVLVTVFDAQSTLDSLSLANELRQAGLKITCYPEPAKLGKQFKYADRIGARIVVVAGPDELSAGQVTIKDLSRSVQQTVARSQAAAEIKKMLE